MRGENESPIAAGAAGPPAAQERSGRLGLLLWAFPPLLGAAELLVGAGLPLAGMLLHGLSLVGLANYSAFGSPASARRLALALLLVPLMRIVALALPAGRLPPLLLFGAAGGGVLVAAWLIVGALRLPRVAVGLTLEGLWLQLMLMGAGVGLGYAGYALLAPAPLTGEAPWQALAAAALALLLFAGFAEELVFRGLLQTVARPVLGRWGPLYVALLYAAGQAGFGSPLYALLAFIVGLVFAGVVRLSGSIVGVALAHGASSVVLLVVMPYINANPGSALAAALQPALIVGGASAASGVAALSLGRLVRPGAQAPAARGSAIAGLRHAAGLTYVALGLRAGLPARLIAEIELGLQPLAPPEAARLAVALGVQPQDLWPPARSGAAGRR